MAVVSLVVVVLVVKVMMASVAVSQKRQAHVGPPPFWNYAKPVGKIKFRRLIGYFAGVVVVALVAFVALVVVVVVVARPAVTRSF